MITYNYNKNKITITLTKKQKDFINKNKTAIKYSFFLLVIKFTERFIFNTTFISDLFPEITYYTVFETLFMLYNETVDLLPFDLPKIINAKDLPIKRINIFVEEELENKNITVLQEDIFFKKCQRGVMLVIMLTGFIISFCLNE